ncbi:hypothetical protein GJ496_010437 [Pomphorhynchus laevis]|nr:hypothetical protein GJ496_010437 [Pomphorhynchus laevis]
MIDKFVHLASRLLKPSFNQFNSDANSIGTSKALLLNGFYQPLGNGLYALLPLGLRVQNKICSILRARLQSLGCEIELPILSNQKLWIMSGRFESIRKILMTSESRNKSEFVLCPTHEESISNLFSHYVKSIPMSNFPVFLYQFGHKIRDEIRFKQGLLRSREFSMFDSYSFHLNDEDASQFFNKIKRVILSFLSDVDAHPVYKAYSTEEYQMGSKISLELHLNNDEFGDKDISVCNRCNHVDILPSKDSSDLSTTARICSTCLNADIKLMRTVEIAHLFQLDKRYSTSFDLTTRNNKPLAMCCYGIGISRLIMLCANNKQNELNWPTKLSPFKIVVIVAKRGSIEEQKCLEILSSLKLQSTDDVLLDDRVQYSIGVRYQEWKQCGIKKIAILGKYCTQDKVEIYDGDLDQTDLIHMTEFSQMLFNINTVSY